MPAVFKSAAAYQGDVLGLPVVDVEAALPFYGIIMGFRELSRSEGQPGSSHTVVLARDEVQIGLAENGGDPEQNGCFFEVDDVEGAFAELKANGLQQEQPNFRIDRHGEVDFKVFFVIAPDGLCFCLGQRQG